MLCCEDPKILGRAVINSWASCQRLIELLKVRTSIRHGIFTDKLARPLPCASLTHVPGIKCVCRAFVLIFVKGSDNEVLLSISWNMVGTHRDRRGCGLLPGRRS